MNKLATLIFETSGMMGSKRNKRCVYFSAGIHRSLVASQEMIGYAPLAVTSSNKDRAKFNGPHDLS